MLSSIWSLDAPFFSDFERLRRQVESVFDLSEPGGIRSVPRGAFPLVNIGETEKNVLVFVFAPGVSADDMDVSIEKNLLTIRGKREANADNGDGKQRTSHRRERFHGSFSRVISLPDTVDPDSCHARFRHGVLAITIDKRAETQPRRITVQTH